MADMFSKDRRSEIMRRIEGKNAQPELRVRRLLHALGFRFRLHRKDLPGNPDIVLPKRKTVLFVHGCFWHGHSCKKGSANRRPKGNTVYWNKKLD
jgi:DNA mismatch endonuclease, patch repair protein